MEEFLTEQLPTLSSVRGVSFIDGPHEETLDRPISWSGTSTSPANVDDTATVIRWQAAHLLHKIDSDVLKGMLMTLPGASSQIGEIPIIKSYMNLLLLLHEQYSGKQWITRIPYDQKDRKFLIDQVVPLLRVMRRYKGFRVPRLYKYGLAKDIYNKLAVDYMLLDFIDGIQMPMWTENYPPGRKKNRSSISSQTSTWRCSPSRLRMQTGWNLKVSHALCSLLLVLTMSDERSVSGSSIDCLYTFDLPPTVTASLFLHRVADSAIFSSIRRILAIDAADVFQARPHAAHEMFADLLVLFLMRALIPCQTIGKYNDAPFYITHPDLHNRNIIIDKQPAHDAVQGPIHSPKFWKTGRFGGTSCTRSYNDRLAVGIHNTKLSPIRITGIVDWDGAHPIPLQCAAIYPKFLATLPGAEFPDLPSEYQAPDFTLERDYFLNSFRRKEVMKTGTCIVADLIQYGSHERDFFFSALQRGEIRAKWFLHWRTEKAKRAGLRDARDHAFDLEDVRLMWDGLRGYLSQDTNRRETDSHQHDWCLMTQIILQLETYENIAVESCWIQNIQYQVTPKIGHLNGCMI